MMLCYEYKLSQNATYVAKTKNLNSFFGEKKRHYHFSQTFIGCYFFLRHPRRKRIGLPDRFADQCRFGFSCNPGLHVENPFSLLVNEICAAEPQERFS
jgi:hypothetical protein